VIDDGGGLPADFTWEGAGLGLQIVRRLITEELNGTIELHQDGGTHVDIEVPLPEYPGR
jgi:two-component sensor histidine kinase